MIDEQRIRDWFAAELRERMDDAGLRPYHMPTLCQCKPSSINNYLQGASLPNPWSLVLMAEHLACTTNDLLGYEELEDIRVFERYRASDIFGDAQQFAHGFADRFKRHMCRIDMTFERLSELTKFNERTIRRWVSVQPQLPRTSDLLRVCDALCCTPSELLGY